MSTPFEHDVRILLHRHGLEAVTRLPDYILAAYLQHCLDTLTTVMAQRDDWFGPALPLDAPGES